MENTSVSTYPYLFFAYTVVWGILVVYMLAMAARLKRLENKPSEHKDE